MDMLTGGWQYGLDLEVCVLASKLSSQVLNPGPAKNCHPGVFTGKVRHQCVCAVSSASIDGR